MTWTQLRPIHAALPPDGVEVLVYCPGDDERGLYQVAYCETDIDGTTWLRRLPLRSGPRVLDGVEAWMPIPPGADGR